jgi:hypothetical protein
VWQKCGKEGYPARGWMWLEIWPKLLLKFGPRPPFEGEHARILKNGAATIGVCSAAEAKLAKGGRWRGNGPARQTS